MNTLENAINMEVDRGQNYRELAKIYKNNNLYAVCLMLANNKKNNAQILREKLSAMPYRLVDTNILWKAKNKLRYIGDINIDAKEMLSHLNFYRIALEEEKKSVDMYTDFFILFESDVF